MNCKNRHMQQGPETQHNSSYVDNSFTHFMPCDTRCMTAIAPKRTMGLWQHTLTASRLEQINHGPRPQGTTRLLTPSRVYVESQRNALQHPVRGVLLRDQVCFKHQAGAIGSAPRLHLIRSSFNAALELQTRTRSTRTPEHR